MRGERRRGKREGKREKKKNATRALFPVSLGLSAEVERRGKREGGREKKKGGVLRTAVFIYPGSFQWHAEADAVTLP